MSKKIRIYKPYLDMWLDIGFFYFRTALMRQASERYVYDYIVLQWRFFKWSGKFNLYKPGK